MIINHHLIWNILVKISMAFAFVLSLHAIVIKVINLESYCRSFGLLLILRVFKNHSCEDNFGVYKLQSCTFRYIKSELLDRV